MLVSLERAKQQLLIEDDYDDAQIEQLIPAAVGLVVADLGRDIYQKAAEVPENADAAIVLAELPEYKVVCLQTAVLLRLSSLWVNRESEQSSSQIENPAYASALRPFKRVLLG